MTYMIRSIDSNNIADLLAGSTDNETFLRCGTQKNKNCCIAIDKLHDICHFLFDHSYTLMMEHIRN